MGKQNIIVAITGASGSIYSKILLAKLQTLNDQVNDVAVIFSEQGKAVWNYEVGEDELKKISFTLYNPNDLFVPFASGSADYHCMIICPCSMGTLGRIANGTSEGLIARSADVMLKERRKLIIVPREAPYSLIHLNNMKTVTEAGAIVCPASPSFYSKPQTIEAVVETVTDRILSLCGFSVDSYKWTGR